MPWLPWPSSSQGEQVKVRVETLEEQALASLGTVPAPALALSAFALGSVCTLAAARVHKRHWKRLPTSDWVTPDYFQRKRWIKGVVTSVGDADNFRLYHTPGIGWKWPLKFRRVPSTTKDLKAQTIHIRMAGIDAPEAAHFGRPSMPYAEEALAYLKDQLDGKTVHCQVVLRDQYSRIVAVPVLAPRFLPSWLWIARLRGTCVSLEMLRAGWGITYEQANAEYGRWGKDVFLSTEAEAKARRRGMWVNGVGGETPAEYKKRFAGGAPAAEEVKRVRKRANAPELGDGQNGGWWNRLFGRK